MNKLMGRINLTHQRDFSLFDVSTQKHSYEDTLVHNTMMSMSLLPEKTLHTTPGSLVSIFS